MQPRPVLRILSALWGVALLVAALLAGYLTLLAVIFTLPANPCSLGDQPCNGTVPLRVFGVLLTVAGSGAVIGSLGAAVSYGVYAVRPRGRTTRVARRLFLVALLLALILTAGSLGVHFTTDRPQ